MVASGSVRLTFLYLPLPLRGFFLFRRAVLAEHIRQGPLNQALPADVGADQRGIDVDHFGGRDLRLEARRRRALEDHSKPLLAPALAKAGQGRMIRQLLMQSVADEPADRDIDLGFAQKFAVVHEATQQPGKHQPDSDLGIDAGTAIVQAAAIRHLRAQPRKIKHAEPPRVCRRRLCLSHAAIA